MPWWTTLMVLLLAPLSLVVSVVGTYFAWSILVEFLRAVAAFVLVRETAKVMDLEPGEERAGRAQDVAAGIGRLHDVSRPLPWPTARQLLVGTLLYGVFFLVGLAILRG